MPHRDNSNVFFGGDVRVGNSAEVERQGQLGVPRGHCPASPPVGSLRPRGYPRHTMVRVELSRWCSTALARAPQVQAHTCACVHAYMHLGLSLFGHGLYLASSNCSTNSTSHAGLSATHNLGMRRYATQHGATHKSSPTSGTRGSIPRLPACNWS